MQKKGKKFYKQVKRGLERLRRQVLRQVLAYFRISSDSLVARESLYSLIEKLHPQLPSVPLIRFGPQRDSGYLIPDALDGVVACFSCGVGEKSGFEFDCAERGMEVYLADYSVDGPGVDHARFHFFPKFVGACNTETQITLDEWVRQASLEESADIMIQMDIEGSEYESLLSASPELMQRCRILVVEMHGLNQLGSRWGFNSLQGAFMKILQTHACIHIHPNNVTPPTKIHGIGLSPNMEFTFFRRDYMEGATPSITFPHALDSKNVPHRKDVPLPSGWYASGV